MAWNFLLLFIVISKTTTDQMTNREVFGWLKKVGRQLHRFSEVFWDGAKSWSSQYRRDPNAVVLSPSQPLQERPLSLLSAASCPVSQERSLQQAFSSSLSSCLPHRDYTRINGSKVFWKKCMYIDSGCLHDREEPKSLLMELVHLCSHVNSSINTHVPHN